MAETAYIVLRSYDLEPGKRGWGIENSNVPATNAEAAIRLACKNDSNPAGTYVAVPARSWKPVQVTAVQTTVIQLAQPAGGEPK